MKNVYTISKYKQTFDSDGNEILTQVNISEDKLEFEKENSLGVSAYTGFLDGVNGSSGIKLSNSSNTISDFAMAVHQNKFKGSGHFYYPSTSHFSYDSTYNGTDKIIIGDQIAGRETSTREGTDIITQTMQYRFSAPTTDTRIINTVFLIRDIPVVTTTYADSMYSSVVLDQPCYQNTDEVLVITYRLVYDKAAVKQSLPFNGNAPEISGYVAEGIASLLSGNRGAYTYLVDPGIGRFSTSGGVRDGKYFVGLQASGVSPTNNPNFSLTKYKQEGVYSANFNLGSNDYVGTLLHSFILEGGSWTDYYDLPEVPLFSYGDYRFPKGEILFRGKLDTVVQNTFNKKASDDPEYAVTSPFYNIGDAGSSLGAISIYDTFHTGETSYDIRGSISELIRVEITNSGNSTSAEYKIAKRAFSGFADGSSWFPAMGSPVLNSYSDYGTGYHPLDANLRTKLQGILSIDIQSRNKTVQPTHLGEIVAYARAIDGDGGLWYHSFDLENSNFPFQIDGGALPAFTATDIRGFTTDEDGNVYVACAQTGLWKLSKPYGLGIDSITVTQVITGSSNETNCLAVNYGRYGNRYNSDAKLVALFGDELAISLDGGNIWEIYNSTTTQPFDISAMVGTPTGITIHPDHMEVIIVTTETIREYVRGMYVSDPSFVGNKAYFWDGAQVTEHTTSFGYSDIAMHFHGSGNSGYRPLSKNGAYKWSTFSYNNSSYYIKAFNTLDSVVNITPSNTYCSSHELIYNSTMDDSIVIYHKYDSSYSSIFSYHNEYASDLINSTQKKDFCMITGSSDRSPVLLVGRGLLLGGNSINRSDPHYVTEEYYATNAREGTGRLFHFTSDLNRYKDYYTSDNELNLWYIYGWDGSEWTLDNTLSKTALNNDPIINGLNIQFVDDPEAPETQNFIQGDIWDTYVFDGIVKDDYTTFTGTSYVNCLPTTVVSEFDQSVVPSTANGQGTYPISLEYYSYLFNTSGRNFYFWGEDNLVEPAFAGSKYSTTSASDAYCSIGHEVNGANPFEYKFKPSINIDTNATESTTTPYMVPNIVLTSADSASDGSMGAFFYGIRVKHTDDPEVIQVLGWFGMSTANDYTSITIQNYHPDMIFTFRGDGTNFDFLVDDEIKATIPIYQGNLKLHLHLNGYYQYTSISSSIYGHQCGLRDMTLTYNDPRITCKVGNGVDTGAYNPDFGRISMIDLIKGVSKLYLDGVEAVILYDNGTNEPSPGEIKVYPATGELRFNPADSGKVISGSCRYIPRINKKK